MNHNINPTYANIIMTLARHSLGLQQNDIAEINHLAAPTVSLTLKQMESLGYIIRKHHETDNRKTIVLLTDEGKLLDDKIKECFKTVESKMINNISTDDLIHFEKVLGLMKNNLIDEKEIKE